VKEAERLREIEPSVVRRLFDMAVGTHDVISLGVGEPDVTTPEHIREAAKRALDAGKTHYSPNTGIPELRQAIAERYSRDYGVDYDAKNEVMVVVGGTEALFCAIAAFLDPGDEVILPEPGYMTYDPTVRIAGGSPVSVPVDEPDFWMCPQDIEAAITDRTKLIMLNFPNNPTGAVMPADEIRKILEIAREHDLLVISDEIYEAFTYDGLKHICVPALDPEHVILVNGFSKTYAMTGWRVGYICARKELMEPMFKVHQNVTSSTNTPAQWAAVEALRGPQDCVREMVAEYDRRRKLTVRLLNSIPGFECPTPKGAFYAFVNVKAFGVKSEELADLIFKRAKVVVSPGTAFGRHGEGYLRISYANKPDKIEQAIDRVRKILEQFK
jgi:aminotransferase